MIYNWHDSNIQWIDVNSYQWGYPETDYSVNYLNYQIWTDTDYVYTATASGVLITSIETEEDISFILYSDGVNSIWSDENILFVGTTNNGIKTLEKSYIIDSNPVVHLNDYLNYPFINSDQIRYIHGNENKLVCCTTLGVNLVRRDSQYVTYCTISGGTEKCFITPNYDNFYYTISGSNWTLNKVITNTSNWSEPDVVYTTGTDFLIQANIINDIFITEYTSLSGNLNTLFIATDVGVYVYDEGTEDYKYFTTVS